MKRLTREDIIEELKRTATVACPGIGAVKVLPRMSVRGAQVWVTAPRPDAALLKFLDAQMVEPRYSDVAKPLTEADLDALAGYYAGTMSFVGEFNSARQQMSVGAAFAHALYASDEWKALEEAREIQRKAFLRISEITEGLSSTLSRFRDASVQWSSPLAGMSKMFESWNQSHESIRRFAEVAAPAITTNFAQLRIAPELALFRTRLDDVLGASAKLDLGFRALDRVHGPAGHLVAPHDVRPVLEATTAAVDAVTEHVKTYRPAELKVPGGSTRDMAQLEAELAKTEATVEEATASLVSGTSSFVAAVADGVKNRLDAEYPFLREVEAHRRQMRSGDDFARMLEEFGQGVAAEHPHVFWRKGARLVARPEALAHALLDTHLKAWARGLAFVGSEITTGRGFMDLFVQLFELRTIVELKIIGKGGNGIGWAKSGLSQLAHYMSIRRCALGFLVLFDGRKSGAGEQLERIYEVPEGKIFSVTIRIPPASRPS